MEGDTAWVCFELKNAVGEDQILYESEAMAYEEMEKRPMTFVVEKDTLSGVEDGGAYGVRVYINDTYAAYCRGTVKEIQIP